MNLVVLSGGIDSTSALSLAVETGDPVTAITFDYGQRHSKEIDSAHAVADYYQIPLTVIPLPNLLSGSALTFDSEVPKSAYDAESMADTVVPGRNLLFASLAVAQARQGDRVHLGVHGGDHELYPDCRPEFWDRLTALAKDAYGVEIVTPFLHSSKSEVVASATRLGAPLHLTWSCYEGGDDPCRECGTCVEREQAFRGAGAVDPLLEDS